MSDLYTLPANLETRWASPENPRAVKGAGGKANGGRKGAAWLRLNAGQSHTLAEEPTGVSGTVRRIWATIHPRSPKMLRGLRLDFYWNGENHPAVSAPFGDFFGIGLGRMAVFENAFFSNPEGRSFNCRLPMPFRNGMRLVITNETDADLEMLFYDVNYIVGDRHEDDTLLLHAHFRRENPTTLQQDYEFLPTVSGAGRFLGVNFGVIADKELYGTSWWGEGEVKFYTDGDAAYPTLCGTGTEDYIGTGWGQGQYSHLYQGCPIADDENMAYCFCRYHAPDPVYFRHSVRATIQQIGFAHREEKTFLCERGEPIYIAGPGHVPADLTTADGILFERQDDWSSCAYFYLDRAVNDLPPLAPVAERMAGLE